MLINIIMTRATYSFVFAFIASILSIKHVHAITTSNDSSKWKKECDDFKKCQLVFKEKFINNANEWPLTGYAEKGVAEIVNNSLHMATSIKTDFIQYTRLDLNQDDDFSVESSIEFNTGDKNGFYGLTWGFKDWDNYQYLIINSEGYYAYGAKYEGLSIEKLSPYFSSSIKRGKHATNKIKINTVGRKTYISINGEIVESVKSQPIASKRFGLLINNAVIDINVKDYTVKVDRSEEGNTINATDAAFKGNGSGIILSTKGYIVTNYHVIDEAQKIVVETILDGNSKSYTATVIAKDEHTDLAILKVNDEAFINSCPEVSYSIATSTAEVGTQVFSLGYPMALSVMGKEVKYTDGKISSKTGYKQDLNTYQTTVPIQPGNSGGPLFDDNGKLVGIVNSIIKDADNVSYAIKVSHLKNLIDILPEPLTFSEGQNLKVLPLTEKIKLLSRLTVIVKIK